MRLHLIIPRSKTKAALFAAVLLLVSFLEARAAFARERCTEESSCKELIEHGRSQAKAEKFENALEVYQRAYEKWPEPWMLVSIGRMHQKLGQLDAAAASFRQYLSEPIPQRDDKLRARASEYLAQTEDELSKQKITVATESKAQPAPIEPASKIEVVQAKSVPIYKRWWLWTAVGLGAVVVGAAIGGGLSAYAKRPDLEGAPILQPFGP